MKKCKHFSIHELIPPKEYKIYGQMGWLLLDDRLLHTIDELRDTFGAAFVNTYELSTGIKKKFGIRTQSGLRTKDSEYYRQTSQHTYGRACDMKFMNISAHDVRKSIKRYYPNRFKFISGIENDVSWLHVDVGNRKKSGITFF